MDVGHLRVDDGATTGLMVRERRILGAAQVVYARTGSAGSRLSIDDVDRAATDGRFAGARWLHVTGITPALSTSAHEAARHAVDLGRTAGLTVSFDVNLRRRLWSDAAAAPIVRTFAEHADVVFGSPDELAVVTGSATADPEALARAVLDLGPAVAVVKLGSDGALGLERHGTPVTEPGDPACPRSSTRSAPVTGSVPVSSQAASTARTSRPPCARRTRAGPRPSRPWAT